jgi:hypothetical protein
MWPYLMIAFLVVIPGIAFCLSRHYGRKVCRFSVGLIAFGCLNWLILILASATHFPLNPEWAFGIGIISILCGISAFAGFGFWKILGSR